MPLLILSVLVLLLGLGVAQGIITAVANRDRIITLSYAELNPLEGTIPSVMAKAFRDKVEELSGGSVRIDIHPGGVLGGEEQILSNMLCGGNIADISRITASALIQYGCDKAGLLSIPYTFSSEDHFWTFAQSDLAQEFLREPREIGLPLRGLCYGEEGFRNFFFKDKVTGLDDLKNRKIRVSPDPTMTGMVNDLGAIPTTVSFTELYSALSTGVVDGAEQPTPNYRTNAFPEVAPYLLLDGHTLGVMEIVMAEYSWERLTEQQQEWIMEAARYAAEVCREEEAKMEANNFELLKADGVTIIPVEDKDAWKAACQPTIEKYSQKNQELYQQILNMQ